MRTKTYFAVTFLILAVLLSGCAGAAFAQTEAPTAQGEEAKVTRTVTVTGSGKVYLTPDIAYITIGVHTEGENAAEAVASNNAQAQKVIDANYNQIETLEAKLLDANLAISLHEKEIAELKEENTKLLYETEKLEALRSAIKRVIQSDSCWA